ncbi:MAG: prolipoprotein diacylglyceryl transferase [Blastocatellia bacterium]|nr:prolipoprotein diacylglyceryl transferase [Blastocatellia bacterium]
MFPELLKITDSFTINTYGVLIAIAFFSGMWLAAFLAEKDGLDKGKVYDLCLYMLLASLVGSRLLLVITEWPLYSARPGELFSFNFLRSGGVYYGGLIGAMVASLGLMRWYRLPWWQTADACAPGIAIGQFFGRLGCFAAGCCWGKPTDGWFGVHFTERAHELTGVPVNCALHPTQLYESVAALLLCGLLLFLSRTRRFHGEIVLMYLFGYGVIRFSIELVRDDPRGGLWHLSTSQLIAIMFILIAIGGYFLRVQGSGFRVQGTAASEQQKPEVGN